MPRGAIYKSRTVRGMSVELVDRLMTEILATPEFRDRADVTFDEGAMRLFYTAGDHAVRTMLRLEAQRALAE